MATDLSRDEPGGVAKGPRTYRYYDLLMAAFVTILICSNFISVPKRVTVGPLTFGAGVLFFPISYLFGDILTEVYGYARSRKVVWAGFTALGSKLDDGLALLAEMIRTPRLDEGEFDRLKGERLNDILQARADPGRLADESFLREVYVHTMKIPAESFRDWAGSDGFLLPVRRRIKRLGLADGGEALVARAVADASWRGLAALVARTVHHPVP